MKRVLILLGLSMVSTGVLADTDSKWYASITGGSTWSLDNVNVYRSARSLGQQISLKPDHGYVSGISLGYKMSNAWRLEGEITHSRNEIEQGSRTYPDLEYPPYGGNVLVGTIGHISSLTIMGNIWYDLQVSKKVNVYFGGGIGSSHYRFDDIALLVYPTPYVQVLEKKPVFDDTEWSFTSQLGTGVEYKICDKLMLGIGARYLITPEISVKVDDMDYDGEQQRYTFDFSHMNILLGLRFFF